MITVDQYRTICNNLLGLRVNNAPNENDLKAQGYAMCITKDPAAILYEKNAPEDWETLLEKTLADLLTGFHERSGKYLAIVSPSTPVTYDYRPGDGFPQCKSRPIRIHASLRLDDEQQVGELVQWVTDHIPAAR
jgi:hypothetical protein